MDILNEGTTQDQMSFIEWFSENYPDFFEKVEKEFSEEYEQD